MPLQLLSSPSSLQSFQILFLRHLQPLLLQMKALLLILPLWKPLLLHFQHLSLLIVFLLWLIIRFPFIFELVRGFLELKRLPLLHGPFQCSLFSPVQLLLLLLRVLFEPFQFLIMLSWLLLRHPPS